MIPLHGSQLTAFLQAFQRVLSHGFQHTKARLAMYAALLPEETVIH